MQFSLRVNEHNTRYEDQADKIGMESLAEIQQELSKKARIKTRVV